MRALLALCCGLSFVGCNPPAAPPPGEPSAGNVTLERVANADAEPGEWFTTGRDFGEAHFSPLDQINTSNASELGFAWEYQAGTKRGFEATPIVVDGKMFTSGPWGFVYALDAQTGAELWRFDPEVDGQTARFACCDIMNRGVAVWHGKVFVGALDGRLIALDAASGEVLWQVDTIVDHDRAYTITGAPRIAGDVVVIGNSGAELDARGYITAYEPETGVLAWRFFTVPANTTGPFENPELELAAKTWDPNSRWDTGGGGTVWDSMVYDPALDLLYVGTGNGTMWNLPERSPSGGDNLFLASILAINPKTGRLVWHYQELPGETWDYTATQHLILADLTIGGTARKVIMQAPKNGIFYVLDRESGEFLSAEPYVPITWASGIDPASGRPNYLAQADFSTGPKLIAPNVAGGHNWHPMSFSPRTGLVYIPALETSMIYRDPSPGDHPYRPKAWNTAVEFPGPAVDTVEEQPTAYPEGSAIVTAAEGRAILRAWDPVNQKTAWERELPGGAGFNSGILTTGGGLVVQGSPRGTLNIYDAGTGTPIAEIAVGTSIVAAPMSYAIGGEQYIAVMAGLGGAMNGFGNYGPDTAAFKNGNEGRIIAFKLGGGAVPQPGPRPEPEDIPPPPSTASAEEIALGAKVFGDNCDLCHTNRTRWGAAPNLLYLTPEKHDAFNEIVLRGALRANGMPQWDDILTEADANAMHAYLIDEANKLRASAEAN